MIPQSARRLLTLPILLLSTTTPSPVQALEIPANVNAFYHHIRTRGACRHELKGGFHSIEGDGGDFGYCGDYLDEYSIIYLQGRNGQLVNMDVDCDGAQTAGDGRCKSSTDTQSQTSFKDTLRTYGHGLLDLDSYVHPYVVFGNDAAAAKSGWPTFDPQDHGVRPLSVMAVVCNNQLFYGIWGDTNGDDGAQPMVGEASLSLATACFGNGINGNQGHDENDVLYIAFTGNDAVPGAAGANWSASTSQAFSESITGLGNELVGRVGIGGTVRARMSKAVLLLAFVVGSILVML